MAPPQQQQLELRHPPSTQKVQLVYKLFLLERARRTLVEELGSFTNKAYDDVQGFLNPSSPSSVFSEVVNTIDTKCRAIDKLSALLKDFMDEPRDCIRDAVRIGVRTSRLQPLGDKGFLMTDVLKFGPMLQNVLLASSLAKAVQVVGGSLSLQQLKGFLISQPAAARQDDMINRLSRGYNGAVKTASSSCNLKGEEKEQAVIYEEKSPPDDRILPPAVIHSPKNHGERPPLLPPIQAAPPEISRPTPMKLTPLIKWGQEDDVQVQHQKQTSSQLQHFLRAKAKNLGALEVTVVKWNKSMSASSSPQSASHTIKSRSNQFGNVVTDDLVEALAPKTFCADTESQAPVFRVKRTESSGSLTYTCVIATKTELWDIGDIFTEVHQAHSDGSPEKNEGCQTITAQVENSCVNIQWKSQTLQCTEPERQYSPAGAGTRAINRVFIPEFQIRKFEETEVVVSHVLSPGNFYIQHADALSKLQALVTDSWNASSSYAEQNCIPDIGTQVMGWFPPREQWFRAQVTKICGVSGGAGGIGSINVEVRRLDHGDAACLSLWHVKDLTPGMAVLPFQALQVSLANVVPVNGRDWSEEAVDWFRAMVHNRTLYARIYPQGPKVTVELFLEKGKLGAMRRSASLSLRLAQNGHAQHSKLKTEGLMKSTIKQKLNKQSSDWEKHLISCYAQSKKSL